MKLNPFINKFVFAVSLVLMMNRVYAGTPLWTFTPLTATTISLPSNSTASVSYTVTNQSERAHTLTMTPMVGVTQITTAGVCGNPFTLSTQGESCVLSLHIDGSQLVSNINNGPIVCEQESLQCYRPGLADILNVTVTGVATTTLSSSVSSLALATSGNARTITITNTGSVSAENLSINYPTWPSGTSAASTCGSTLAASSTCTITVTPGANATSSCAAGSAPTPGAVTVSASNGTSVTTDVVVLANGCIYQEGYIFSIDDTTASTTSIGGTAVSLANNSSSMQWYNGSFVTTNAQSLTDGTANTSAIVSTQGAGTYAATLCSNYTIDSAGNSPCSTGTCYSNWYLPAICQMGAHGESAGCSSGIPNMEDNLSLLISGCTGSQCLSGYTWSSTEYSGSSLQEAWTQYFSTSSTQILAFKQNDFNVRCVRNLT